MTAARRQLPGELSPETEIHRMIRVDQAGEYGAARIYAGQLRVLRGSAAEPIIAHMAQQEQRHLDTFNRMMSERRVRPTALAPLWHMAGFALGAATALMGEKAAMACTTAVESVIDEHYASQERALEGNSEHALSATISEFRAEEREHHDTAMERGAESAPFYDALSAMIRRATRSAIWLSTRL